MNRSARMPALAALAALALLSAAFRAAAQDAVSTYGGREMIVHAPASLPLAGSRALVVVLHGGLGNAGRIVSGQAESALNLDKLADEDGFVVAYLNGTPVTKRLGAKFLGWNAGDCCGVPAEAGVDDVGYIRGAVDELASRYGIDKARVYGIGHSNGAMMTQRIVCETHLYAAAVAISGPLDMDIARCPAASGARILAIHGADDQNVPVAGGVGAKGLSHANFKSEASSKEVMTRSSAAYTLDVIPHADHRLDHIDDAIRRTEGVSLGEKAARFFGLSR